jgi:hypothetical protein
MDRQPGFAKSFTIRSAAEVIRPILSSTPCADRFRARSSRDIQGRREIFERRISRGSYMRSRPEAAVVPALIQEILGTQRSRKCSTGGPFSGSLEVSIHRFPHHDKEAGRFENIADGRDPSQIREEASAADQAMFAEQFGKDAIELSRFLQH